MLPTFSFSGKQALSCCFFVSLSLSVLRLSLNNPCVRLSFETRMLPSSMLVIWMYRAASVFSRILMQYYRYLRAKTDKGERERDREIAIGLQTQGGCIQACIDLFLPETSYITERMIFSWGWLVASPNDFSVWHRSFFEWYRQTYTK